ncbi:MAG: hypothetical protein UV20_C0040G0003 [Candidatus Magasanikbacteria bacterium GW2011_GWA2_42_32]|uniref:Uncharacterized protein n=1 Tax=Candidatus Magasanikbacteria bacterium GW2011_GWA2_42_32 TaxID=1619039 RepID=A0A0G0ZZN6_9BACT|nr:MAG: hypothetical protein UV20_C0040G0003 [Candidatus Magasanikbacteria bacterium GW2011_GWA2_42_32]
MNQEKKCGCQGDCNCNNLEEATAEIKEVIHEVQAKVEDLKDQAMDYAKEHEIGAKVETVATAAAGFVKEAKDKYDQATPETKEKIKEGVKKGAMILGTLLILKKIFGKKK